MNELNKSITTLVRTSLQVKDLLNMVIFRKIFAFADVPHLVKLLRNHIMDEGLKLPSGKVINGDVFQKLLAVDSGEFRLAHKLDLRHLAVSKRSVQLICKMTAEYHNFLSLSSFQDKLTERTSMLIYLSCIVMLQVLYAKLH